MRDGLTPWNQAVKDFVGELYIWLSITMSRPSNSSSRAHHVRWAKKCVAIDEKAPCWINESQESGDRGEDSPSRSALGLLQLYLRDDRRSLPDSGLDA